VKPTLHAGRITLYKVVNFTDFILACDIIKQKAHLTEKGITTLKAIKSGMNTGRSY